MKQASNATHCLLRTPGRELLGLAGGLALKKSRGAVMNSPRSIAWALLGGFAMTISPAALADQPKATSAPDTGEAARIQADRELYAGTWRVISIEANGNTAPNDNRLTIVENLIDGTWKLSVDGREVSSGTSTMDPLATPKEIDIEIVAGDGAGSVLKGIYEVGDKTRLLCFRGGNGWRPREFSGAVGSDSVLVVFERQWSGSALSR
ncbi:MAG: TIGR03067 domain-containing protein [Planctomycetia bacterium]